MGNNRLYRFLSRITDIKKGEETLAVLISLYFFLITAPYSMIKALRNAKLLDDLGQEGLPPAYLLTAILTGFVVVIHSKIQTKISKQLLITSSLIFFTLTGLLFWLLFPMGGNWLPLIYWVWANILIVVLITHFWLTVNGIFNPREAKRLIGFFGSGGILGGVIGGFITIPLADSIFLLPIACSMLFACIFVVKSIYILFQKRLQPREQAAENKNDLKVTRKLGFKDSFNSVRKTPYLVLIAATVTVSMIVTTLIDFQFNTIVVNSIDGKEKLTAFFGLFFACLMIFAFFFQLVMTSNLLKRLGIRIALLLAPVILIFLSLGIAIVPILALAIFIKGSEKSLSLSLSQSIREILYIPIVPELKNKAKIFIDMFLNRFAKGITAIILMILMYFNLGTPYVSSLSIISLATLIFLSLKISKEYVTTVKQNIKVKWDRADKAVDEKLDVDYTKLVFDTLESKNRSSVLYAMHVFDLLQQDKLSPEVKNIISQKADEVKVTSFGNLFDAEGTAYFSDLDDETSQIALKTDIREIMSLDAYQEVMKIHANHVIERSKMAEIEKMELAKAIGLMGPDTPLVNQLEGLIYDDSPEVSRYAIESAAKLRKVEHIPALIHKLGNPLTRADSVSALDKFGESALNTLEKYLGDPHRDIDLRKAVVTVLSKIGSQKATDVLLRELDKKVDEVDSDIIDALDRIRSEKGDIQISTRIVKRKTFQIIKTYCQSFLEFRELKPKKKNGEKQQALQKKIGILLMDIFKLLGLFYPHEDIVKAYQNIKTGTKDSVAYAIELLDNSLKKDLRDILLPLIEDQSSAERERKYKQILKNFPKF